MAINLPSLLPFFFPLLLLLLLTPKTIASHHHHNLKSLHFSLYQHETINKTGYFIVDGIVGPGISQTTTPFGTIFAFRDNMTTSPKSSSLHVQAIAEGFSITSSFDGLSSLSAAKITLNVEGHQGSVSILGSVYNTKPSDLPVVGGTGDFLFVQGYVRSAPVDLVGITVVYKIEFFLYWPPYATSVHKFRF